MGKNAPLHCPYGLLRLVAAQPKLLALKLFMAGALPLAAAYIAQYGYGLQPCILCLYQRVPFFIVMVLGLLAFYFTHPAHHKPGCLRILMVLAVLAFLVNAAIAFFHVGVEQHWWAGTEDCGGTGLAATVEALRHQILGTASVRCDEPGFFFLGITMAGWNVVYCLLSAMGFMALEQARSAIINGTEKGHGGKK